MSQAPARNRPKHLNLFQIRLPIPGIVSILHRISGASLFLMLPFLLYLLQQSLQSPESYIHFRELVGHPLVKLVLLGLLWAFLHHFCAGIRYLTLDMHMGTDLAAARSSSYAVVGVSLVMTVILGVWLW
jgi:succinate dehydrogenase / fumarate reductase cytochrome b subunit